MVSLSSVSHSSKLMKPKVGVEETSDYCQPVSSKGNNLDLQLVSEVQGGNRWDLQAIAGQSEVQVITGP